MHLKVPDFTKKLVFLEIQIKDEKGNKYIYLINRYLISRLNFFFLSYSWENGD